MAFGRGGSSPPFRILWSYKASPEIRASSDKGLAGNLSLVGIMGPSAQRSRLDRPCPRNGRKTSLADPEKAELHRHRTAWVRRTRPLASSPGPIGCRPPGQSRHYSNRRPVPHTQPESAFARSPIDGGTGANSQIARTWSTGRVVSFMRLLGWLGTGTARRGSSRKLLHEWVLQQSLYPPDLTRSVRKCETVAQRAARVVLHSTRVGGKLARCLRGPSGNGGGESLVLPA